MEFIVFYFDWGGTAKELETFIDNWKKAAQQTEGVEFKGYWIPHTSKWHHAVFYEADSYTKVRESWQKVGTERDYSRMTHGAIDLYVKPRQ